MSDTRDPLTDPQPAPTPGDGRSVTDAVIADMEARRRLGVAKYGQELTPHCGRDALQDHYEELLDACLYVRQLLMEREAAR